MTLIDQTVAVMSIQIDAGTSIERASEAACGVAQALGIRVDFDFNGVRCLAHPTGRPEVLAARQQIEQARPLPGPRDVRYASSLQERG